MVEERTLAEGGSRFLLRRRLGAGGFGVVHEAFDRERNAEVALKTLARVDPIALYRFKNEFRALADLRHPNLVELYELVREGDDWLLSMERVKGALDCLSFIRGTSGAASDAETVTIPALSDAARPRPTITAPAPDYSRLRSVLVQLASALEALHGGGILHRDIKPSNVLVDEDGRVVVVDFGIATDLRRVGSSDTASMPGTPEYMAPEQGTGDPLTAAADWYAVGVILFEALTGRLPFLGTPLQILLDKQRLEAPRPSELAPGVPGDLAALALELLRIRPEARPSGPEVLRRLGAASPANAAARSHETRGEGGLLIGRDAMIDQLAAAFAASKSGRPVCVLVSGRSGVGKTALVRRFLDLIAGDAVVLAGRCYERESVPYKALDAVIDELARALLRLPATETSAVVPRDAAALVRLFPVLSRVSAIADAPRRGFLSDPQHLRQRGFGALRELLARLADRRPVVMFIDDLQWGDADSAALLAELAAPPDPPSFLLVGSARTSEGAESPTLRSLLRADARAFDVRRLEVEPLDPEQSATLSRALLGADAPDKLVASIADESRGEPMLLRELVDSVQSEVGAFTSGFRLEHLLSQRLRQLPDAPRRLLEVVSVAGRPLQIDHALRAAELSADERREALDWLRVARFARATGGRGTDTVEPYHDRVRQALLASLDEGELRALHERLARTLRELGEADPEALYAHYAGAGLTELAARFAEEAGEKAAHALAFDRAAQFYRHALDLGADEERRGTLFVALGDALAHLGNGLGASEAFLEAAARCAGLVRLDLERRAAEQLLVSGRIDAGIEVMRGVLGRVGLDLARTPGRALLAVLIVRFLLALRGLRFKLREVETVPPKTLARIDVCWSAAAGLAVVDNVRAAQFQTENLLSSLRAGEPERLLRALVLEAVFVATRGPAARAAAARRVDLARGLLPHQRARDGEALIALGDASVGYFTGDFRVAAHHSELFVSLYEDAVFKLLWSLRSVQYFGLSALLYLGEIALLRQRLPAYLRDADERGDLYFGTNLRVGETNLCFLIDDQPDEARRVIDEAMSKWSGRQFHVQHWYEMQARAQIDLYRGEVGGTLERVEAMLPALRASFLLRVHHTRVKARWLRGRCALATPELPAPAVREKVTSDARALERERAPWAAGLAALLRAGLAAREERPADAIACLRGALVTLDAAGLALFGALARVELGRRLGGAEGKALHEEGERWLREREVVAPQRLLATFIPGVAADM